MAKRQRKKNKKRKTIAKLIESLKNIKFRIPTPPPTKVFKSIKDYNRRDNKKSVKDGIDG